jgi:hypothetical protein
MESKMLLEVEGHFKAEVFLQTVLLAQGTILAGNDLVKAVADIRGTSRSDARRVLSQGGVTVDGEKIDENTEIRSPKENGTLPVLRTGKKWKTKIVSLIPPHREVLCLAVLREGEDIVELAPMREEGGILVGMNPSEDPDLFLEIRKMVDEMNRGNNPLEGNRRGNDCSGVV